MAKKFAKVLVGSTALALALTGCGGKASNTGSSASPAASAKVSEAPKKDVTFSIIYAPGDPATKKAVEDSIAAFGKAFPHIKIKNLTEVTSASYLDFLKTKDAVGEFPDLVEMRDTQLFADNGKLAELPKELQGLFDSIPQVNGKVYNAPIALEAPHGIIYSKKAYADAGITEEPKTYADFLAAQEKLKAKGISPIVMGGKDIFHWGFWINKYLMDEVLGDDPNWNSKRSKGQVSFTDAGPMKAMTLFTELFTKGYVDPGFMSTADNQTASMLVTGKAASLFSGPWMFPQIAQADPKFEFGFYPVPDQKGRIIVNGLAKPSGWSLSAAAAKDPDKVAAMSEFIKFFFSKDNYAAYLKAASAIPSTKEKISYEASPQLKEVLDLMADPKTIKSLQINAFWGENQMPPTWRNWFYKLAQDWIIKKDFSVEQMKKADAEWDAAVKAMKK
ncbi:raffinose/stachyose/melibiose transport system substrate-binding protein [Paenibacillus sp. V4I3]|uniref:ABC transporter substrate-binding protein n=1 Tax=unclassified Paenibacillus TaxID=185978 RepID=UPI002783964A|nr:MULTISPECIES: extracellular solute-binding protein [unclassified Paenibacillus]MDQ0874588.1 raffinose/stachyose/melibiose transport system substrate-binding protein [Paenibacillus sp. V4I3]MDQ0889662.1 raffinose/stachyose/melibiose transport system substrate-binding protein [Paenibacillus sp. V4I9]